MMDTLENLKTLFLRIMRNDIDHFGLVAAGEKFKIDINQSAQFSHQKNQLKCAVLQEILKSPNLNDDERDKYKVMLDTTIKLLHLKASMLKGFPCSFVGCLFRGKKHRDYVKHLKDIHPTSSTFQCGFNRECERNFVSISDLKNHVPFSHNKVL